MEEEDQKVINLEETKFSRVEFNVSMTCWGTCSVVDPIIGASDPKNSRTTTQPTRAKGSEMNFIS
jgi:hypothetical protein